MAQAFEEMSDLDKGIFFRQACDKSKRTPFGDGTDRETVAHFFRIYGVEAPAEVINSAQEVIDYQLRGVTRTEVAPLDCIFDYFHRQEQLRR